MILTEERIREAGKNERIRRGPLFESLYFSRFDTNTEYDLFISHSFNDKDFVGGLKSMFRDAGYNVYIDWIDDKELNRKNVTTETAELIKERINGSKGTAYISTTNSTSSKWCPWELGFADGNKGRVCILPVMSSSFIGQEYLGLYPYIQYSQIKGREKYDFWVYDQADRRKYVILSEWLKGKDPSFH